MSGINFIGSYSGIDQGTIDKLMEAHRMPLKSLANKKTSITDKQNAWKDINTRLNSLFEKLKNLEKVSTFTSKKAASTNDKMVSVSVGSTAPAGRYDIKVNQLASSSRIIGGDMDLSDMKSNSKITITDANGTEIDVDLGHKELKNANDVAKAINKSIENANNQIKEDNKDPQDGKKKELITINATAINGRLVLTDETSGARNIGIKGDGETGIMIKLGLDKSAREEQIGKNAEFTINGMEISSASNTVKDVIEGMTLNLHRAHDENNPRDYETIVVEEDLDKAANAMKEFVDQYNSTMRFIGEQTKAGDPDLAGSRGKLAGEGALMRLESTLRNLVTGLVSRDKDAYNDISQLGVSSKDRSGELSFDADKFKEAMKENPNKVIEFFSGIEENAGYVSRVNKEIDSFISTKKDAYGRTGIIKSTMESYDRTIKDLNDQIERFNERMEKKEEYYIRVFSALDVAMMKAESQMGWLQGQVDAMNNVRR